MDEQTTRTLNVDPRRGSRGVVLVVYHEERVRVVPLRPRHAVTLGRGPAAEVQLEDELVSRAHARVELVGDEVWVEDLGSKNGTLLDGEPIRRARLTPADRLEVGSATAFVHVAVPLLEDLDGVEPHDQFVVAVDDAIRRGRTAGRKLALLFVQTDGRSRPREWLSRLVEHTRPYDRLGVYSSTAAELMLWDTDAAGAEVLAGRILREPALAAGARCGVALCPDAADSAESLIEAAHRAALAAMSDSRVRCAAGPEAPPAPLAGAVMVSPAMRQVYATAARLARSSIPVLITGETGTGKELVARAIHEGGDRNGGPMVCLNCGAIPQSLVESELFGHERGAFTGADRRSRGLFEEAHGGTLLLDEVGELPLAAQAALLRVLETKRFSRIGSKKEIAVDVRVVAATHRDLEAMCREGAFREDLLYRINSATLEVPPLRARREEIPALAEHFLRLAAAAAGRAGLGLAPEVQALLAQYAWPGNVRELRNVIERGVALAEGAVIGVAHLPVRLLEASLGDQPAARELPAAVTALLEGAHGPAAGGFRAFVQRTESALIRAALDDAKGNRAVAARALGLPLRTLAEKIRCGEVEGDSGGDAELLAALEATVPAAGEDRGFRRRIRTYEARLLEWALRACASRAAVAEKLHIPERTLRDKLRAYGLGREERGS